MITSDGNRHLAVCRRFGAAVRAAAGKWDRPSPCDAWDARAVLEHVIGFHDVLILRPMGLKPDRPRNDPQRRWELTYRQLEVACERGLAPEAAKVLPNLTRDVLVHTWDLARAVGADDRLAARWCEVFCTALIGSDADLHHPLFAAPVGVSERSSVQSKLLARFGRHPDWHPNGSRR